ncbi:hypothetical protein GTW78_17340, partial [Streptomyces sp. SID4948]|nr:hypothetical protein [Streptomyces sp. SID4948]
MSDSIHRAAGLFHRRMLWREGERVEPMVALLGPAGAGKSTALRSLASECGSTVVHATLDFAEHDLDSIPAAAMVTFDMMRGWANRRELTFHRFALGLLALNEELDANRARARDQINELIRAYVRNTGRGRSMTRMERVTEAAVDVAAIGVLGHIGAGPTGEIVQTARDRAKPAIGSLLQSTARWGMRDSLRFYGNLLRAETVIDGLIALSRATPAAAVGHLLRALLADMRDNDVHRPPLPSACTCLVPGSGTRRAAKHGHAWMLLVDNADTSRGRRFLADLADARCARAVPGDGLPPAYDPLLVVAAFGEWQPGLTRWWSEPWRAEPRPGTAQRRIPPFSRAERSLWANPNEAAVTRTGDASACWYPVWLEPLNRPAGARPAARGTTSAAEADADFVGRLSAGHPAAMADLNEALTLVHPAMVDGAPNARGVMDSEGNGATAPLWRRAVTDALPDVLDGAAWHAVPDVATAAAYLADRQSAQDGRLPASPPGLSQVVESLRRHLWISTFNARPSRLWPIARGAAVHPA